MAKEVLEQELAVSGRKKRPGSEHLGFTPKPEGPEVFQPQRERPHALIPVQRLSDGQPTYLAVRWPASTARRGPVDPPVVPEVIRMGEKPLTRITYPDPYLDSERLAAERKQAKGAA